ncbi:MAG: hypothetical protein JWM16_5326, partial [Verrucomicrobiales bacterium]|nr:hypothetical protein [Verrucomicrobiales bacterium]
MPWLSKSALTSIRRTMAYPLDPRLDNRTKKLFLFRRSPGVMPFVLSGLLLVWVGCAEALIITNQPQSQSAVEGVPVTLAVGVDGAGPFTYQWSKGGVPIPGATRQSYVLENPLFADSGYYSVAVMSGSQTEISSNATVGIAFQPQSWVTLSDLWRYVQTRPAGFGNVWAWTNYDDSAWSIGMAAFGVDG